MSKLWAVSSGEYSDYSVNAVFDTEEDARAAVALGVGDDVLEMDYYRSGDRPVKRHVWFAHSGRITAEGVHERANLSANVHEIWTPESRLASRPVVREQREGKGVWVDVQAPTKELAEKVLHDRIAKVCAELLGL